MLAVVLALRAAAVDVHRRQLVQQCQRRSARAGCCFWPVEFSLRAYQVALTNPQILQGYLQLVDLRGRGTLISVTLTSRSPIRCRRKTFFGRNVLMTLLIFTMLFSGGLIPTYMVVQDRHAQHPVGTVDPAARSGSGR